MLSQRHHPIRRQTQIRFSKQNALTPTLSQLESTLLGSRTRAEKATGFERIFGHRFKFIFERISSYLRICFSTYTNGTSQGGSILYREGRACHIETGAPQYTENSETGRSMSQRQPWLAPELYETGCWPMRIDTLDDIKTRLPLRST